MFAISISGPDFGLPQIAPSVKVLGFRFRITGFRVQGFRVSEMWSTLETTQGQIDGFVSQLPIKRYLPEVASVGD